MNIQCNKILIVLGLVFLSPFSSAAITNPILFVTQIPIPADFCTINATFCNHRGAINITGRGGDLWIRYPDGTLKNLTASAGLGKTGLQGGTAIQVRDPAVFWSGKKAIFSMVVGAPAQYQVKQYLWQLYEVTGLGKAETPAITKVPNQPPYNNVSPIYGTDSRIIFVSDRPRNGQALLYPQLDEYEEQPTNTGIWSLAPATGHLKLLNHAPSGDFNPFVDSFGRIIFTQWDHLQQDQQAASDRNGGNTYGTFNYANETSSTMLNSRAEVFPEPLKFDTVSLAGKNLYGHSFNHFFPWQMHEDGSEVETINHVGRHELGGSYVDGVFTDDPVLTYLTVSSLRPTRISNFFQIKQDPVNPNEYIGIDAPEFGTHASGQIVRLINGTPGKNPDNMIIKYVTDKATKFPISEGQTPPPFHSGLYRDPLVLSDGSMVSAHTFNTYADKNLGTTANPQSRYDYRLRTLKQQPNGVWVADQPLTNGIKKAVSYYDPDTLVSYTGDLWELQPVEVKARPVPTRLVSPLPTPEAAVFQEEGVSEAVFRQYLLSKGLALAIMRNVTVRDDDDKQQPFNLRVAGTATQKVTAAGKIYDIAHFQAFQGDQIRGLKGCCSNTPVPGRRVLAQVLHSVNSNPPNPNAPKGSVKIANDGSVAMLLPARRALSWQLTDPQGNFVVRERNWLSFQPGEIRTCPACHGVNNKNQVGSGSPVNKPKALRQLLQYLKSINAI
ncbi:MAG: hypothetical protein IPN42_04305 [Methylococcaceae bacterium]|nr:hypothetical protein [Methylococcaceae bacterium]